MKESLKLQQAAIMLNETLRKQFEQFGLADSVNVNFKLQEFANHDEIEAYLASDNYE